MYMYFEYCLYIFISGVTLVVSPLVSLMEDQVMALHSYGVDAEMLNASTSKEKSKQVHVFYGLN